MKPEDSAQGAPTSRQSWRLERALGIKERRRPQYDRDGRSGTLVSHPASH